MNKKTFTPSHNKSELESIQKKGELGRAGQKKIRHLLALVEKKGKVILQKALPKCLPEAKNQENQSNIMCKFFSLTFSNKFKIRLKILSKSK